MRIAASILVATLMAAPALAQTVNVTQRECRQLVEYTASPDVNYKPGTDALGRPVAGADLAGGQQIQLPEVITMAVKIDFSKYMPTNQPSSADAVLAAERSKTAVSSAQTAANQASATSTAANAIVTAAQAAKTAADAALSTAQSNFNSQATPANVTALNNARTAANTAATTLTAAQTAATNIQTAANNASTAATSAASATATGSANSLSNTAAQAAATAASLGQTMAGTDASRAALLAQAQTTSTAATTATSAATAAIAALNANNSSRTPMTGAFLESQIGEVKFDRNSGQVTFNGQPLDDPATREIRAACQRALGGQAQQPQQGRPMTGPMKLN